MDSVTTYVSNNQKYYLVQEMQLNHQIEIQEYANKLLIKDHELTLTRKEFEQQLERKDHVNEILTMKSKVDLQEAELNYMRQLLSK
jgi:CYTH domain-containing protein